MTNSAADSGSATLVPAQTPTVTVGFSKQELVDRLDAYVADPATESALSDLSIMLATASARLRNVIVDASAFDLDNGSGNALTAPGGTAFYSDLADQIAANPYAAP